MPKPLYIAISGMYICGMKKANPNLQAQFVTALRLTNVPEDRIGKAIQTRLVGLGFENICSRCGGCGHYSFNLMDGTICYGCYGSGRMAQPLTADLLASVQAISPETFDAYLVKVRENTAIKKVVDTATKRVLDAWQATGVSKAYDWREAADQTRTGGGRDLYISDRFNKPMCEAYERVSAAVIELQRLQRKTSKTAEQNDARRASIKELSAQIVTLTNQALEEITRLGRELSEYLTPEGDTAEMGRAEAMADFTR